MDLYPMYSWTTRGDLSQKPPPPPSVRMTCLDSVEDMALLLQVEVSRSQFWRRYWWLFLGCVCVCVRERESE